MADTALDPGQATLELPIRKELREYSTGEEIANAVIHGLGAAMSVAGLAILLVFASVAGDGWHLASAIVYGISLILLYTASTLYHAIRSEKAKYVLKIMDHSAIYLLIAGTYTPFTLVTLREAGGWWLFALVWGLAFIGIALETAWVFRPRWMSALIYIGMGWIIVFVMEPLAANLAQPAVALLIAGGLAYTGGTAFYVLKRVRYMHAVWHGFVLGGSVCHFLAVVLYVLPDLG